MKSEEEIRKAINLIETIKRDETGILKDMLKERSMVDTLKWVLKGN